MKGVIFDADHTLYTPETDRAYEKKFAFLAEHTEASPGELSDAWTAVIREAENGSEDKVYRHTLIRHMLERVGADPREALVDHAYDLFWETVVEDLTYEDGIAEMLERLNQEFDVLAIATDEFPEALQMKLSTVFEHPENLFDDIVTPEDAGEMKPSTVFFHRILDSHGIAPEDACMVGDSWERDLAPAQELGMTTIMVSADTSSEPLERDNGENPRPDHRVDSVLEVESLLEAMR